ncbi:MAG: dihydropteroate synthase [Micrococcus sp.]|nr:dihydropteroate synthase [Micrococcus sp.]
MLGAVAQHPLLQALPQDRTLVMGILNVTPDSFSDGGQHTDPDAAIAHARALRSQGADLIDVGGESTRPGATPVDPHEEQDRILPVIEALLADGIPVSADTMHVATAEAALQLGPVILNDVSGLHVEEGMPELVAASGAPYILMHNRGTPTTMDGLATYADVVGQVIEELCELRERFLAAGVRAEQLLLDPGLGFAKAGDQNWALLHGLPRLRELGHPVLVAASRKRFLGTLVDEVTGAESAPQDRDIATAAVSALAAQAGAWAVRVHDVGGSAAAVRVAAAWTAPDTGADTGAGTGAGATQRHGAAEGFNTEARLG